MEHWRDPVNQLTGLDRMAFKRLYSKEIYDLPTALLYRKAVCG